MMLNNGWQARGLLAWSGSAATPRDISGWNNVSFQIEVTAAITTDAVFSLQSYAPQSGNACAADSATETPVLDIPSCVGIPFSGVAGNPVTITIPAGTAVGTIVWFALNSRPNKFVGLKSVSGTVASVKAIAVLTGPIK